MTRARRLAFVLAHALLLAWGFGARPAGADDPRLAGRLDPPTAAAVERIVESARSRGLPVASLVSKALEGAAKRAPGERIVAAVRAESAALAGAREALGDSSSEAELVAGAAALMASVPGDSLTRLRAERPGRSLVVPLVVLSDLVARAVPPAAASSAVLLAARAGARDSDLLRYRQRVERDIASGSSPEATAFQRARSLRAEPTGRSDAVRPGPSPR